MDFKRSPNTDYMYGVLTSPQITEMSGGRIPQMTPQQAAGLLGSWVVETGDPTLTNLDVVEAVAGKGRGLSQYTGVRRIPYERAIADAKRRGENVNSAQWQMQYFADEYVGKFDQDGRSLSGYTRIFERMPAKGTPSQFAEYVTGSADSGRGYFRPSEPHTARRQRTAEVIYKEYSKAKPAAPKPSLAIPKTPAKNPVAAKPPAKPNLLNPITKILGIIGVPGMK